MKRSDIPSFLKKMTDIFDQKIGMIPEGARPEKKTMGDLKAFFSDGARMTLQQLIEDGVIKMEEEEDKP